ncbi:MAG: RidA family protein [Candidatus Dadabacteria bacterium]|nr:RidA family protein [Candidatus Dadabacteria bacterium]MCY4042542.1 RidA family protein [Candidatus Dadabacteria bacterium]
MSDFSPEQKLREMGIVLPGVPSPAGSYRPCVRSGRLVFISGQLPLKDGKLLFEGLVGGGVSVEQAALCARQAAVNCLAVLSAEAGGLGAVGRIVKVTGYVASAAGFVRQADVVNGASDLFAEVFGERGRHSRAAVGASALPLGAPVEIEAVAEVRDG